MNIFSRQDSEHNAKFVQIRNSTDNFTKQFSQNQLPIDS